MGGDEKPELAGRVGASVWRLSRQTGALLFSQCEPWKDLVATVVKEGRAGTGTWVGRAAFGPQGEPCQRTEGS